MADIMYDHPFNYKIMLINNVYTYLLVINSAAFDMYRMMRKHKLTSFCHSCIECCPILKKSIVDTLSIK